MSSTYITTVSVTLSGPDNSGNLTGSGSYIFPSNVTSAGAALQGWSVSYPDNDDHNVLTVGAKIFNTVFTGNTVTFQGTVTLADDSGNKAGTGTMEVLVIAYCNS
jgi:hypothetical protein